MKRSAASTQEDALRRRRALGKQMANCTIQLLGSASPEHQLYIPEAVGEIYSRGFIGFPVRWPLIFEQVLREKGAIT